MTLFRFIFLVLLVHGVFAPQTRAQSTYNQTASVQGTDNLVRAKLRQVALGNGAAVRTEIDRKSVV